MTTDERFEVIRAAKERVEKDWLRRPGVHSVSIGLKRVGGRLTDVLAIAAHVLKKRPLNDLTMQERIPLMVEGIPTDVIESGQPQPTQSSGFQVQAGYEIAPNSSSNGTLGWFGGVNGQSGTFLLTNQHVLPTVGGSAYQAGYDVATVYATTDPSTNSTVDGAIAQLSSSFIFNNSLQGIGQPLAPQTVLASQLPLAVQKSGATSGVTSGSITNIGVSGTRTDGWVFTNQFLISPSGDSPFVSPGDSGSLLVTTNIVQVGLVWGNDSTNNGYASPIMEVQSALGINLSFIVQGHRPPPC